MPLPNYDPSILPLMIKRGQTKVMLVDVQNKVHHVMFTDPNNKWGYNKVTLSGTKDGRFRLFYVVNESETDQVIKRYDFPTVYEEGLRKIVNLHHKKEDASLW